jgi:hypothetical protein
MPEIGWTGKMNDRQETEETDRRQESLVGDRRYRQGRETYRRQERQVGDRRYRRRREKRQTGGRKDR